jgi:taurine---2-oxoglutarate transaminase
VSLADRQAEHVFYTWTAQRDALPLEIVSAQGARFQTADGADWLDLGSMTWNANLGHGHAGMRRAMVECAERSLLAQPASVFPEKVRASERLLEIAPRGMGDGKVFICLSGAEANENAVKMARLFTGRRKIIHRSRSYHGATLGMLSLSGDPRRKVFDPGLPGGISWDDPYSAVPCEGDLETVLRREGPDTVAAVLLEGIVGYNGVFVPPAAYYRRIRELCDRHGILFIADEVLSGFGRTGRWFAVDHDDVAPDLITCAKGLTAGYAPGGAVIASARIARYFDDHILSCGLTAYAHPMTCAAIAAAIDAYQSEKLIERAGHLGGWLKERLVELAASRPFVREVRGRGLLWAIELEPAVGLAKAIAKEIRQRHLHMHKRDNLVFLAPPLMISEDDLQIGVNQMIEAIDVAQAAVAAGGR